MPLKVRDCRQRQCGDLNEREGFYAKDGAFLRAELTKAKLKRSIEYPVNEIQEVMERESMIVTGLPKTPPKMSLSEILTRVNKGAFKEGRSFSEAWRK